MYIRSYMAMLDHFKRLVASRLIFKEKRDKRVNTSIQVHIAVCYEFCMNIRIAMCCSSGVKECGYMPSTGLEIIYQSINLSINLSIYVSVSTYLSMSYKLVIKFIGQGPKGYTKGQIPVQGAFLNPQGNLSIQQMEWTEKTSPLQLVDSSLYA